MGCLYRISFPNGKSYIGITMKAAEKRFAEHCYEATKNNDRALKRAIRKYGSSAAILDTLVIADDWCYLATLERAAIKVFDTFGHNGYNMTAGGDGAIGYRHTPESLKKMGDTHRGKAHHTMPHSEEAKRKMSIAAQGRTISDEAKRKLSEVHKGNKYNVGRKQSDETRRKRVIAVRGKAKVTGSSGHVGVSFCKRTKRWRAHLTLKGKMIDLGRYQEITDAINARVSGEGKYFSEGARDGH